MGRADSIRALRREQLLVAGDPLLIVAMLSRSRQKATQPGATIGDSYGLGVSAASARERIQTQRLCDLRVYSGSMDKASP